MSRLQQPSRAVTRLALASYGLALVTILLDQLSKYWILYVHLLPAKMSTPFLGPMKLSMVWNRGISFGLFRADQDLVRWALTAFSVIVAIVLAAWARKSQRPLMAAGLGLVMGGAIGNAIDRARFGAVVDFIDVSQLWFPWVFNVADAAITVGVLCLLLDSTRRDPTP